MKPGSLSPADNTPVNVAFCTRKAGYGCGTKGIEIAKNLLGEELFRFCTEDQTVDVEIGNVRTSVECMGCMNICSASATAEISVSRHTQLVQFSSLDEFQMKFRQVAERTEDQWIEMEEAARKTRENLDALIKQQQQELRGRLKKWRERRKES